MYLSNVFKMSSRVSMQRLLACICCINTFSEERITSLPPMLENTEFAIDLFKSYVRIALYDAHSIHGKTDGVELQLKPTRGVFAIHKIKPNSLCLVPVSSSIAIVNDESSGPSIPAGFRIGPAFNGAVAFVKKFDVVESLGSKPFIAHFWNTATTKDAATSNVEIRYKKVSVASIDQENSQDISVPVLINHVAVSPGDELLLYVPEKRKEELSLTQPAAKAAKTEGKGKANKGRGKGGRKSHA